MKKILIIILIISITVSISACAAESGTDTPAVTTAGETEPVYDPDKDDLPEKDYEGYNFRIYSRNTVWFHGNITVEELDGEVLNDAIYNRNAAVAQRFNISFTEELGPDTNKAQNAILADDDAYDMINARCTAALTMAQDGLVVSLDSLPYIDLEKNYWNSTLTADISIGENIYFPVGDMNLTFMDYACILLFNNKLHTDFGLENPYDLVRSGKWTFDKYNEMALAVVADMNGDGKMGAEDRYGTLGSAVFPGYSFLMATGVKAITKNADNEPVFAVATDTKFIEMWETVLAMLHRDSQWYDTKTGGQADPTMNNFFKADQALFYSTTFFEIEAMRDMDTDFGILPHPKYNEEQTDYKTRVAFFDMMTVPVTNSDFERTSIIIEALTCESATSVFPAYYEIAVSAKATRDEESVDMLDIIKNTRTLDLADNIWCDQIRNGFLVGMIAGNNSNIVSMAQSRQSQIDNLIQTAVTNFSSEK